MALSYAAGREPDTFADGANEPYFGPAQSTLELALAANEKSSEATEAIRKLISVSRTGSVQPEQTAPLVAAPVRTGVKPVAIPARRPGNDSPITVASIRPADLGETTQSGRRVSPWALGADRGLNRVYDLQAPAYGHNAVSGHGGEAVTTDLGVYTPEYPLDGLTLSGERIDRLTTASTSNN